MPASSISIENAKTNKLFYVVLNVVVHRNGKCLILKRHPRETAHPDRYGVIGGKMEWDQMPINSPTRINGDILDYEHAVEELLKREAMEEAGIEIEGPLKYINSVSFIRPDGIPCVLIKFAAEYKSGNIVLEEGGFTDYQWVDADEVKQYDCIDGVEEEVNKAISFYKS